MSDIFLGLDLGTSGCKLIAFDGRGRELARATRGYPVANPGPGQFELDADRVWGEAEACFREVRAGALPGTVRTLAVSVLGEAVLPVDRSGRPLAPAPISADMRAMAEVERLGERFGPERIHAITGQILSPISSLPKLMWWRAHRPALVDEAWKFVCFGEFALMKLGLPPVIDEGMAARMMAFDVGRRGWSQDLLDMAGLVPSQLAAVAPSGTVLGSVPDGVAAALGLPPGVRVVLGGHDQPMGALGAGIVEPGTALYAIGTTEALVVALEKPAPGLGARNIPCYAHVMPGRYVGLAGNQSGARVLAWYREAMALAGPEDGARAFEELLAALEDRPPAWPLLLPHFAGSGSVLNDNDSLGALFGLRFETSRQDILLALLEGITFEQALSLEALSEAAGPVAALRAIGGGTRSALWLQMKADILDRPVTCASVQDAPCLGGAILGRAAVEPGTPVAAIIGEMVATGRTFHPRPDRHAVHAARLAVYRSMYTALRPLAAQMRHCWQAASGAPAPA
ncbi:FGGY-family carbohydrate kinase [Labrys monachus]|uniref:Xylulokinase n=1 Tax=Labrys monachus TaxID=217067 RepID=A0ABU0FPG7_9HYPH|nr:FGGY-family carbohydrate kinase [Labrys monachus]MDQ0396507.1 xylulokinase [Labrys monachus]